MNDEIKFIKYNGIEGYIELMKHDIEPLNDSNVKNITLWYDGKDIKAVLDYITNLQKENKELKDNLEVIDKSACFWEDTSDIYETRMNNYLSRIDKAIEYIKEHKRHEYHNGNDNEYYLELDEDKLKYLLNILRGSDKDVLD